MVKILLTLNNNVQPSDKQSQCILLAIANTPCLYWRLEIYIYKIFKKIRIMVIIQKKQRAAWNNRVVNNCCPLSEIFYFILILEWSTKQHCESTLFIHGFATLRAIKGKKKKTSLTEILCILKVNSTVCLQYKTSILSFMDWWGPACHCDCTLG